MRDMDKGTTCLSQTHYAKEIVRTYNFCNATPRLIPMQPNTCLNKGDYDNPAPDFIRLYSGIVGSLGYLVTMTRPDLAWAYFELNTYVQFPGKHHMLAAEHILSHLSGTCNQTIRYSRDSHENPNDLWGWVDAEIPTPDDLTRGTFS